MIPEGEELRERTSSASRRPPPGLPAMRKHLPLLILCSSTLRVSSFALVPKGKALGGVRGLAASAAPARDALKVLVFLGSTRVEGPPRPARVGVRVAALVERALISRGHSVSIVDPVDLDIPLLRKPHFSYARGKAPEVLETLAGLVASADCYVMVNHLRACFPKPPWRQPRGKS